MQKSRIRDKMQKIFKSAIIGTGTGTNKKDTVKRAVFTEKVLLFVYENFLCPSELDNFVAFCKKSNLDFKCPEPEIQYQDSDQDSTNSNKNGITTKKKKSKPDLLREIFSLLDSKNYIFPESFKPDRSINALNIDFIQMDYGASFKHFFECNGLSLDCSAGLICFARF